MVNYSVVLSGPKDELIGIGGFYDYDEAVSYMSDWTEIGRADVVDFHTGELLFTLVPEGWAGSTPS